MASYSIISRVDPAEEADCPTCGEQAPWWCRTKSRRTTKPHQERIERRRTHGPDIHWCDQCGIPFRHDTGHHCPEETDREHQVTTIRFEVLGVPQPQGSKTAFPAGGKVRLVEGRRPESRAAFQSWRDSCTLAARAAAGPEPLDGTLHVTVLFRFPMPANRPKRVQEAGWCPKTTAPDLDKLQRALGDSLEAGGLIRSDARIASWTATKIEVIGWTGATVTVTQIGDAS